ncbi:SpoIIE family protein phosphatase [Streptomyces sp. TRM68367]|uniref:SpoIIE family protein phosphatase n=1 Tax=Streptomyces sp. TRM68367 TaxID=2758415 RepID=UPI00165B35A2|nr:SpoIIE family protein phosphatase [Streptomyces sp. TRM68367]MBC9730950.1 SpoIIE family protein phosphatase [Streptomyces sp. TRM68367]
MTPIQCSSPGHGTRSPARGGAADRAGGGCPAGPPIGTEVGDYESTTFRIDPGTVLLLYTDGLVEQRDTGIDDAVRALTGMALPADGPPENLLDIVLTRLTNGMCEDGIALLAARRWTGLTGAGQSGPPVAVGLKGVPSTGPRGGPVSGPGCAGRGAGGR